MMVNNYKLSDMINIAAAYIPGDSNRGYKAITTGQTAVQSLLTILEYFDSSDVQNLKVCISTSYVVYVTEGIHTLRLVE
jgi:hypothetical protein